jgi:hypothetical protein
MDAYQAAERVKASLRDTVTALQQMLDEDFSADGAWLFRDRDRFYISGVARDDASTGGWLAIEQAASNERLTVQIQTWKDEVLTGITARGKRTKINRAVLSTANKLSGHKSDPESSYFAQQQARERQIEAEVEGVRRCSAKGCLKELETASPWCKSCARKRMRVSRKKG